MEKQIKAVVFDMDGTLIDTERIYFPIEQKIIREMGYEVSFEEMLNFRSLNGRLMEERFHELCSKDFDFQYFCDTRDKNFKEYIDKNGIPKKPGADEILAYLRENDYPVAVATATYLDLALKYLKRIGFDNKFDRVISVSNVKNSKPKPDVYLEVCRQLGMEPKHCMAVEDSDNGVRSAYAAGMRVVMVPDLAPPMEEVRHMIYGIADTLADVKKFL
ncbi:MAG: HAD family phosphatase [Lachnospiraceae bacterium]|jgi:HAD superfamily hydrolase (TIGR01509 family)|nr:HAD family phosphatase [Lachnospiraceae bacterium]